jgi:uncharacterized membrane protein YhdT
MATSQEPQDNKDKREGVGLLAVIQSTLAAAFGVQSSANRERDFKQGKASQFIISGIVFTLLFIGVVVMVVRLVLADI